MAPDVEPIKNFFKQIYQILDKLDCFIEQKKMFSTL